MDNPVLLGIISWIVPGAGHLIQKRWGRGAIIAGVIWTMFIVAILGGGAYYPGFDFKDGALLYLLNIFARCGNGLGAVHAIYCKYDPHAAGHGARGGRKHGGLHGLRQGERDDGN